MADKKTKAKAPEKRRSAADIEARNKASQDAMIELYGLKASKKPASPKK